MPENHVAACELQLACTTDSVESTLNTALDSICLDSLPRISQPDANKGYRRALLAYREDTEIITARWVASGQSSLHGHGDSAGLYRVISGAVIEERYLPEGDGLRCEISVLKPGDSTYLPPGSYHRLHALEPSVTLHAYSPIPEDPVCEVPLEALEAMHQARCKLEIDLAAQKDGMIHRHFGAIPPQSKAA